MDHTYLRYECADSFGLSVASGSSKAPQSNDILQFLGGSRTSPLLTIAGSQIVGTSLKTSERVLQIGHREQLSGGVGTGRALNSDEVVCLAVSCASDDGGSGAKVATGWIDGAVRIFDLEASEVSNPHHGLAHSLLEDNEDENFARRQPLVLKGHESAVRSIVWDSRQNRLASGGSDGAVILWDVVAECGLFRLIGHRGGITNLQFVEFERNSSSSTEAGLLISSSLDGLVKIWDLNAQCCTQTIASHRGEVRASACLPVCQVPSSDEPDRWRLVTGGTEGRAKVWSIQPSKRSSGEVDVITTEEDPSDGSAPKAVADDVCFYMGQLIPPPNVSTSAEKISCIHYHPSGKFVGILQSGSKNVDVYAVRSAKEAAKKRQRRLKRRQEKQKKRIDVPVKSGQKRGLLDDPEISDDGVDENKEEIGEEIDPEIICASDEFEYVTTARASHKVRGFAFCPTKEKGELVRLVCALSTNSLETMTISRGENDVATATKVANFDRNGHPTGIRSVALSSDDRLACTVSKSVATIWNVASRRVVQTITPSVVSSSKKNACYGLCGSFLPGNNHIVVGTREGHLIIIDISTGEVIDAEENAHDGAIWSLDVKKSSNSDSPISFITGSADKSVKFWDVESDEETDAPIVVHSRTLHMTDDVVAARYSNSLDSSKRMVFVSTLDSTIKVFFDDTLKLFLNLYGHKLPALAVDASDDDMLLASSGADKTIKLWGLDFGDTHRTLHGHQDSITDLRFVRRTHNFFSASKDGTVRYWDGDRFEQILLLHGHCAEVNCLGLSRTGAFLLSGGMDRQVRVWERTQDIVFLEEERERELEAAFDNVGRDEGTTADILRRKNATEAQEGNEDEPQSEAAVKRSVLSVSGGDRIIEGVERADAELKEAAQFRKAQGNEKERASNPMMLGLPPAQYVLWILRSIPFAELEQSLLVLPLNHIERLTYYLIVLLKEGRGVEICTKVGIFLVKTHQNQLIASRSMSVPIRELKRLVRLRVSEARDVVGYNLAAMRLVASVAAQRQQTRNSSAFTPSSSKDIWAGLGLGSDVAAVLQGKPKGR